MTTLITGGNRGIGAALAETLTAQSHDVIATSRDGSTGIRMDVTDPASITALANTLAGRTIDTLVCNAGVYLDKGHDVAAGYAPELWSQTFAANVTGVFLSVHAFLPILKQAAMPKIAIISSQMGSSTKASGSSLIYRTSKAAALNLGLNLANALKPDGIAVGIYHPGWVRTDMGGSAADISMEEAATGLAERIGSLSLMTTGCFENWDGRPHPI